MSSYADELDSRKIRNEFPPNLYTCGCSPVTSFFADGDVTQGQRRAAAGGFQGILMSLMTATLMLFASGAGFRAVAEVRVRAAAETRDTGGWRGRDSVVALGRDWSRLKPRT